MDLPCKIGTVDPSIGFASDVQIVASESRECSIEVLKSFKGIFTLTQITMK